MKVLSVASEVFPLVKTGGLADVAGALPGALAPLGVEMRTLLPGYPAVLRAVDEATVLHAWPDWFGGPARLVAARHAALDMIVLDAPHLYARRGNPYVAADGHDWPDNAERFAALSAAAAFVGLEGVGGTGGIGGFAPDVVHAHDWQAALVPAYLRDAAHRPATVLTVHNLAFQGRFPATVFGRLALPARAFDSDGVEYFGDVGFLKAGLLLADAVTTVSPGYAREIRTPAAGTGLDPLLRWRGAAVSGIVNGIDTTIWDPAHDVALVATYDAATLERRVANKRAVEARFGLAADDAPLLCMITRLTEQKGIDLVVAALDAIVVAGARLVVLGSGDAALEAALVDGAARWPASVAVRLGYDEALSHLLQGGSDAIVVPSRFEPCGLTQLYGLRYGCVPVVARVGGLADTVIDANDAALKAGVATGLQFGDVTVDGLIDAIRRTVDLYRRPAAWRSLQAMGMRADVGWSQSASQYATLYRSLVRSTHTEETR